MDTFFVLLITSIAAIFLGALCTGTLESNGPRAQTIGAYASVPLSMLIFAFSLMIAEDSDAALWSSLSAFLCTATAFGIKVVTRQEINKVFLQVPKVVDMLTKEFASFDVDDDKVISIGDLERILKGDAPLPKGCDHAFVEHVKQQINLIGHDIGKYTVGKTTSTVVVISARDVRGYPTRVAAKHSKWLTEEHDALRPHHTTVEADKQ